MTNTVALGAALSLINSELSVLNGVLKKHFGGPVADENVAAAAAGYEHARSLYKGSLARIGPVASAVRMLMTGNEALSLGAIAAGCKFMAAYPMTPTTSIMEYLAAHAKECNAVMVHAEDEIAAIHMAIGASYAGVRAMTATSGSGFCLMSEGLGLAGMTETPVVIVEGQRAGPAIGFPTRMEQGDLLFLLYAHQGEFARAILAPTTIEDCFWSAVKAFNLADKYQTPVFVLTDSFLASSFGTVDGFDLSKVVVDRGAVHTDADGDPSAYLRHKLTDDGISPRAFPGRGKTLVVTDSDEHDEAGHMTEDAGVRTAQMDKRLRKLTSMVGDVTAPYVYGPEKADVLLIGWGSTYGALQEAADLLRPVVSSRVLQLNQIWPFPSEAVDAEMRRARLSYVVENNATGQLARLIRSETGNRVTGSILKYDGRPFTPAIVASAVRREVS
jgi:2-oxoglutarate ferredoxin oxidoreductase subunit alpha